MPRPRKLPLDPLRAVAYLRVSTEEQRLGPEAQRATLHAWAAREGLVITVFHTDQGVSGTRELEGRPGLMSALASLRSEKAGVLLIAKRDRLARDVAVAALIERAVKAAGARIVSADGMGNGQGASDDLFRGVLDVMAQYERALIGMRTRAALAVKKAQGTRLGGVPFGFRREGKGLVEEPAEQATLAQIYALRGRGFSYARIARWLDDRKVAPRSGQRWHLTQVVRLLGRAAPRAA